MMDLDIEALLYLEMVLAEMEEMQGMEAEVYLDLHENLEEIAVNM